APTGQGEPDPASGTAGSLLAASVGVYGEHLGYRRNRKYHGSSDLYRPDRTGLLFCLPAGLLSGGNAERRSGRCLPQWMIYGEAKKKYMKRGKICREPRWGVISRSVHI